VSLSDVPAFPDLADLGLEHKPLLDGLFRELKPGTSELTFTNLYIWRHAYRLRLTRMGDVICLLSWRADPEDSFVLPPLGPGAGAEHVRRCFDFLAEAGHAARLGRIDGEGLSRLGIGPENADIAPDRDNWDYVYRVRDLIDLPEDRFRDKLVHFNAFARKYKYEYRPLTPDLVEGCLFVQDLWCDDKHCDLYSSLRAEARAVREVLQNHEALGVAGGVILVNGRVQAFSLGEPLNDNTCVIHIEKASPELHGAFAVINREFLAHQWVEWEYVNREQDMGEPGLRRAKESYQPAHMIEKFIVRAKGA
jgi:hypothetical protein